MASTLIVVSHNKNWITLSWTPFSFPLSVISYSTTDPPYGQNNIYVDEYKNTLSFGDLTLPDTTYYFSVKSGYWQDTTNSNIVSVTTPKIMIDYPQNIKTLISVNTITLSWDPIINVSSYKIYYDDTNDPPSKTNFVEVNTTSYKFENLTYGNTYFFVVVYVSDGVESIFPPTVSGKIIIPIVNDLTTLSSDGEIKLSWTLLPNASSYNIYDASSNVLIKNVINSPYTFKSLNSVTYYFYIKVLIGNVEYDKSNIVNGTSYEILMEIKTDTIYSEGKLNDIQIVKYIRDLVSYKGLNTSSQYFTKSLIHYYLKSLSEIGTLNTYPPDNGMTASINDLLNNYIIVWMGDGISINQWELISSKVVKTGSVPYSQFPISANLPTNDSFQFQIQKNPIPGSISNLSTITYTPGNNDALNSYYILPDSNINNNVTPDSINVPNSLFNNSTLSFSIENYNVKIIDEIAGIIVPNYYVNSVLTTGTPISTLSRYPNDNFSFSYDTSCQLNTQNYQIEKVININTLTNNVKYTYDSMTTIPRLKYCGTGGNDYFSINSYVFNSNLFIRNVLNGSTVLYTYGGPPSTPVVNTNLISSNVFSGIVNDLGSIDGNGNVTIIEEKSHNLKKEYIYTKVSLSDTGCITIYSLDSTIPPIKFGIPKFPDDNDGNSVPVKLGSEYTTSMNGLYLLHIPSDITKPIVLYVNMVNSTNFVTLSSASNIYSNYCSAIEPKDSSDASLYSIDPLCNCIMTKQVLKYFGIDSVTAGGIESRVPCLAPCSANPININDLGSGNDFKMRNNLPANTIYNNDETSKCSGDIQLCISNLTASGSTLGGATMTCLQDSGTGTGGGGNSNENKTIPSNVVATPYNASVKLTWNDNTGYKYQIEYGLTTDFSTSTTKIISMTNFVDITNLTNGKEYSFQVKSINSGNIYSAGSAIIKAIPIETLGSIPETTEGFWSKKYYGLPIWAWIVIVIGIVILIIIVIILVFRNNNNKYKHHLNNR